MSINKFFGKEFLLFKTFIFVFTLRGHYKNDIEKLFKDLILKVASVVMNRNENLKCKLVSLVDSL